ncbi:RidA family protein [Shimwellia pseudoproteus]|uniref:Rid family hydrolase n=1 Tax=Shimwellia pseudoproteus TaxID=570012 RepID=UPI0018ED553E|nr:Rid family hydrolase [Shimwellia pseudoproteus]MBJ3814564.1 RidA family protein [Shimwellia pseudoproteus]
MNTIIKASTGSAIEQQTSYSRVVAVDNWIFVSNTAGRDPHTRQIPEDIAAQTLQVFANVERALNGVDACLADTVVARVFVQFPHDVSAVAEILGSRFRGIDPALTLTCPPLGAMNYKVEMEITAVRGGGQREVIRLTL